MSSKRYTMYELPNELLNDWRHRTVASKEIIEKFQNCIRTDPSAHPPPPCRNKFPASAPKTWKGIKAFRFCLALLLIFLTMFCRGWYLVFHINIWSLPFLDSLLISILFQVSEFKLYSHLSDYLGLFMNSIGKNVYRDFPWKQHLFRITFS